MSVIQQLILALFLVSGIKAQYGGGDNSMTTKSLSSTKSTLSSSTQATANPVQSINVGEDGFTFSPDTLTVSPGDKVEFHFFPGDHSVTQSSFTKPCHPLSDRSIFSGFVSTTNSDAKEVFTLIVNDTHPIWLYCAQIGHCQAGMVARTVLKLRRLLSMSGQDTLAAFKAAAAEMSSSSEPSSIQGGALGVPSKISTSTSNGSTATSTAGGTSRSSSNVSISTTSSTSSNTSGSSSFMQRIACHKEI
ncbi:cupredoxin [Penicillium pulvis]|uniref:cupredoxin n=1 Tax=Penicillium pulvis TaxID=1562058 RepID=UPI002547FAF3|nr:cupredoxin [Penicillium pulvis]KAJ5798626.1 cupredoxin [Penicillium pulvis]